MDATIGRPRWVALGGLAVTAVGYLWDLGWHGSNATSPHSGKEVAQAHTLLLLGAAIMLAGLAWVVTSPGPRRSVADWIALAGAAAMAAGFTWDSIRHLDGAESLTGHVLIYGGALAILVGMPTGIFLARRSLKSPIAHG